MFVERGMEGSLTSGHVRSGCLTGRGPQLCTRVTEYGQQTILRLREGLANCIPDARTGSTTIHTIVNYHTHSQDTYESSKPVLATIAESFKLAEIEA